MRFTQMQTLAKIFLFLYNQLQLMQCGSGMLEVIIVYYWRSIKDRNNELGTFIIF
jgi:hypothetical protein